MENVITVLYINTQHAGIILGPLLTAYPVDRSMFKPPPKVKTRHAPSPAPSPAPPTPDNPGSVPPAASPNPGSQQSDDKGNRTSMLSTNLSLRCATNRILLIFLKFFTLTFCLLFMNDFQTPQIPLVTLHEETYQRIIMTRMAVLLQLLLFILLNRSHMEIIGKTIAASPLWGCFGRSMKCKPLCLLIYRLKFICR